MTIAARGPRPRTTLSLVLSSSAWRLRAPGIAALLLSCAPDAASPPEVQGDTPTIAAADAAGVRADASGDPIGAADLGGDVAADSAAAVCSLEQGGPEDTDALGGGGAGPSTPFPAFDDVTAALQIPPIYAEAFSWGQVDDDDLPDLFVPHAWVATDGGRGGRTLSFDELVQAHVVLNCPGSAWRTVPLDQTTARIPSQTTALVFDIDGDRMPELLHSRQTDVFVRSRTSPDGFAPPALLWTPSDYYGGRLKNATVATITPSDLDRDGHVELMLSRLYPGPPGEPARERHGANVLLRGGPERFEDLTAEASGWLYPAILQTYTIGTAPSWDAGAWILYLAGHSSEGRILSTRDGLTFGTVGAVVPYGSSMGVDVTYDTGRDLMVWVVSQTGAWPMIELERGGTWTDVSGRARGPAVGDSWGVLFADFDNDGWEDLVYATAIAPQHLILLRSEPDGDRPRVWVDRSASAGPLFDDTRRSDDYALLSADFDRDGCIDLAVGPIPGLVATPDFEFDAPIRVLHNRCDYAGRFVGWRVDDQPGTLYRLTTQDPDAAQRTQVRIVKGASSIGGRSDMSVIHFGLGGAHPVQLEIQCLYGDTHLIEVSADDVGAYGDLRGLCRARP